MRATWRTGPQLGLGVGTFMVMVAGVAASGNWFTHGIHGMAGDTPNIPPGHARPAEHFAEAQASILKARRHGKVLLLNVRSPEQAAEHRKQWDEQVARQMARLDDLERLATRREEKERIEVMRKELAAYDAGFKKLLGLIQEGKIKTPHNTEMARSVWTRS